MLDVDYAWRLYDNGKCMMDGWINAWRLYGILQWGYYAQWAISGAGFAGDGKIKKINFISRTHFSKTIF